MSNDPKKPLDTPPPETPELLQKDLQLDRRNRRVPTFEELRLPQAQPPRPAIPSGTVPASPRAIENVPTQPHQVQPQRVVPPNLQPRQAPPSPTEFARQQAAPRTQPMDVAQLRASLPTQPSRQAQPRPLGDTLPPSAPTARIPQDATGVVPPPRPLPPQAAHAPQASPTPFITPSVPSLGASMPPGQHPSSATPNRAQPAHAQQPPRPISHATTPGRPSPSQEAVTLPPNTTPAPQIARGDDAPSYRRIANTLPPEMLVTQPGMPGPFAQKKAPVAPPAASFDESAPSAPSDVAAPEPDEQPRMPSLREMAALVEPRAASGGDIHATPAALWRRVGAWLVDASLIGALVSGFLFIAASIIAPAPGALMANLASVVVPALLLTGLLAFVYTALFAFMWKGRTPGRLVFGIRLVDKTGQAPEPARAIFRAAFSLVSFGLFLSGFWLALFDRHGQTLHDKLTRTFVVRLQDAV